MSSQTTKESTQPRVLVIVQNLPYALDRRVRNECTALVNAGFGVTVICPQQEGDEPAVHEDGGVLVRSYPAVVQAGGVGGYVREFIWGWWQAARCSWQAHRAEGFAVIQACNPPDTVWAMALLWKIVGVRFVYDQHDLCPEVYEARFGKRGLLHRLLLGLERATYACADRVLSPNPSYQEIAIKRGKVRPDRTTVVMSCPDPDQMRKQDPNPKWRNGRKYLAAYVGVMGPQDGVERMVHAAEYYVRVLGRTDCQFVLMGFGDCLEQLRTLVNDLDLGDFVTFTGRVGPAVLAEVLSTADVGITPDPDCALNQHSTMNKNLEYMAYEVPVVATDLYETRRCVGEAGVYVNTPTQFAEAISALLDSPARRKTMGTIGRARVEQTLRWDRYAADYVEVFRGLVTSVVDLRGERDESQIDLRKASAPESHDRPIA